MDNKNIFITTLVILVISVGIYHIKNQKKLIKQKEQIIQQNKPLLVEPKPIPEIKPEVKIEPVWTEYLPIRNFNDPACGKILSDIESHMPAGHIYRDNDKITWAHETTHGINSNIRMKFSYGIYTKNVWNNINGKPVFHNGRINAFYCLENKAAIIEEPPVTIRQVAAAVPNSLRGPVYNLYLVQQAGSWNSTPLYLCDEQSGYRNGSEVRKDLKIESRAETVTYMLEFNVYCMVFAKIVKQNATHYDDRQFKNYLMWSIMRSTEIYNGELEAKRYWLKFKNNDDATELRGFCQNYFGKEWFDNLWQNIK